MKNKEQIEELISLYCLGLLEGEELRMARDILRSKNKDCTDYFEEVHSTLSGLPYGLEDKPLSPAMKEQIIRSISGSKTRKSGKLFSGLLGFGNKGFFKLATACACVALLYLGTTNHHLKKQVNNQNEIIAELESFTGMQKEMLELLENKNVMVYQLINYDKDMKINARLLWDLNKNIAMLCLVDLPEIEPDKTFQFWTGSTEGMESVGIFKSGEDSMMKIMSMPEYGTTKAFYISIEPEGGMPQPTGETYMVGKI